MKNLPAFNELTPIFGELQIAFPPDEWFNFEKPVTLTKQTSHDGHVRKGNRTRRATG